MAGTFGERISELINEVGHGTLHGEVEVDQVYARYQHEHPEFKHPDGGKAFYLRDPLFEHVDEYMQKIAEKVLDRGGPKEGMKDAMEDLSAKVYEQAPLEFGDLKASGHPKVESDGVVVYDRPPNVGRLSEEELRIKGELRGLFDPNRYS